MKQQIQYGGEFQGDGKQVGRLILQKLSAYLTL